jgi:peptidoglycan-associated lipoprotein|tara:strand:+ start:1455 stop:1943 length:489 start_codon:yes stop_codon:yes gene_type:complete
MNIKKLIILFLFVSISACEQDVLLNGNLSNTNIPKSKITDETEKYFIEKIGDRILFEVDNSGLTALAKTTLNSQADWLLINAEYQVLIEGHADEQGTRDYNLALGARRAQIVKEYLISRGVDPNNISIVTYGKERPLENCSAEVCWSQNRRAVTIVNALSKG